MTVTLGIDLASQPANTALCAVEWEPNNARVLELARGKAGAAPLDDALLLAAMRGTWGAAERPTKIAIDAPLGWPVDFVCGLKDPAKWPVAPDGKRLHLERRITDHWVHQTTGKLPLSVTTDRIGYAAMRAAGLLAEYSKLTGEHVDRTGGEGRICEVYPDPAIRAFGLWPEGFGARESYKGKALGLREAIVVNLEARAPWLTLEIGQRNACIESDDCLDALMCALIARAVEVGATTEPPSELAEEVAAEGWIRLPAPDALDALVRRLS